MATIAENLQTIKSSTESIKQAIIDKGGTISGDITTWASAISGIETGGGSELNKFTISNNEFVFENDMTWGDFVNSICNVIHYLPAALYSYVKFTISENTVFCTNGTAISSTSSGYVPVYATDKIIPNGIYYMYVNSGNSGGSPN